MSDNEISKEKINEVLRLALEEIDRNYAKMVKERGPYCPCCDKNKDMEGLFSQPSDKE